MDVSALLDDVADAVVSVGGTDPLPVDDGAVDGLNAADPPPPAPEDGEGDDDDDDEQEDMIDLPDASDERVLLF